MSHKNLLIVCLVLLGVAVTGVGVDAQGPHPGGSRAPSADIGTAFTYQGQLKRGGSPYSGTCDFRFGLWDADAFGAQVDVTRTVGSLSVLSGYFTTQIDFGASSFTGDARWLAIVVRCPAGSGSYTALAPRQAITPAPYALALPGLYTQQKTTSPMNGATVLESVMGGTRVAQTIEAEPGGFFKLAEPLLVKQQQSQMEADLAKLKQILEG